MTDRALEWFFIGLMVIAIAASLLLVLSSVHAADHGLAGGLSHAVD